MTDIISRIRPSDGQLVQVYPDGREEIIAKRPLRSMMEAEVEAAAVSDPDAQPLTPDDTRHRVRTPQVRVIRRALRLSQEEFAAKFQIPLGTLRDWEQGRKKPDAATRAYLTVIGRNPSAVTEALHLTP